MLKNKELANIFLNYNDYIMEPCSTIMEQMLWWWSMVVTSSLADDEMKEYQEFFSLWF